MKKLASLILALTLCMALAVPAFAEAIPEAPNYVKFDYTQYFDFSKEPLGWYKYPFGYWGEDDNGDYVYMYNGEVLCLVVPDGTDVRMKQDYAFVGCLDVTAQNADFIGKDFEECDGMMFGWGDYPIFADQGFDELSSYPYYVFTDVRIYPRSLYENPQAKATDEEYNFWYESYLWEEAKEIAKLKIMTESFAKHYKAVPENSAPAASGFTDVAANAYYADAVKWAVDSGVTKGTSETTFSPDADLTRAQAVTFLWRAKGSPKAASANNPFTDVKQGEYYYDAVLWAVEQGITNGVSATEFGVNGNVTRGQMVTFLWRTEGKPNDNGGAWYESAENWASAQNLLTGTAQAYSTNGVCPRADVVFYLWRDLAK